jgi:hypothetical protein
LGNALIWVLRGVRLETCLPDCGIAIGSGLIREILNLLIRSGDFGFSALNGPFSQGELCAQNPMPSLSSRPRTLR